MNQSACFVTTGGGNTRLNCQNVHSDTKSSFPPPPPLNQEKNKKNENIEHSFCPIGGVSVGVDTLDVFIKIYGQSDLNIHLDEIFRKICCQEPAHEHRPRVLFRVKHYTHYGRTPQGGQYAFVLPDENSEYGELWVSVSGQVFRSMTLDQQLCLLLYIKEFEGRLTRIDLRIDDYRRSLSLDTIESAVHGCQYVGYHKHSSYKSHSRKGTLGRTYYLGSPNSDRKVRIYDKEVESGGQICSNRYEVQFRRSQAQQAYQRLTDVSDSESFASVIRSLVTGSIDFRDRDPDSSESHVERLPVSWFWAEFLDFLQAVPLKIVSVPRQRSLQKSLDWLHRQVSTTLAVCQQVMGHDYSDFIHKLTEEGKSRISSFQETFITQARSERRVSPPVEVQKSRSSPRRFRDVVQTPMPWGSQVTLSSAPLVPPALVSALYERFPEPAS